jgi:methyltransferase (TIGR00027 family)
MAGRQNKTPDSTAVRVALWRAMHVQADQPPHVHVDEIGLRLAAPDDGWRARPDMDPRATSGFRASIVARARFIEDLVTEKAGHGVAQYVILGAGLDTFAQRKPEIAARLTVFEVDQPGPQAWKRERLIELGYGIPDWLRLVPADFEVDRNWLTQLSGAGFDAEQPAIVVSTGVTMYLTKETTAATLRQIAGLAPGSTVAMTFLLTPELLLDKADRSGLEASKKGAQATNTPFISFYRPDEMLALAREAGFKDVQHVPGTVLADRYFAGRADGLRPSSGEDVLVASRLSPAEWCRSGHT